MRSAKYISKIDFHSAYHQIPLEEGSRKITDLKPYVFCYLDDIIIVTENYKEHLKNLEIVLNKKKKPSRINDKSRKMRIWMLESKILGIHSKQKRTSDGRR